MMPKILLADEEWFCNVHTRSLQYHGYEVVVTHHVEGIEENLAQQPFDLLVMEPLLPCQGSIDHNWPGVEAFERIVSQPGHPPVIVATCYGPDIFSTKGARYLPKPYTEGELLALIERMIGPGNPQPP